MLKQDICPCFLLYLELLFLISPSDAQMTTKEIKGECNSTLMTNELIADKPSMNSTVGNFTPRFFLTEIKRKNCTVFIGDLKVNSFGAENRGHNEFVRVSDLENLRKLEVIRGSVQLELSQYNDITNLSFFAGLKAIYGYPSENIFSIRNSKLTQLFPPTYLISVENMELIDNKNLCYLENFTFPGNLKKQGNKNLSDCKRDGKLCYDGCYGCYGPDNGRCISCKSDSWGYGFFQGEITCEKCDPACESCKGRGRKLSVCTCKVMDYRDMCVFDCPNGTLEYYKQCKDCSAFGRSNPVYNVITETGFHTCEFCDKNCFVGCSGKSSKDCHQCKKFKYFYDESSKDKFECVEKCPVITSNYFRDDKTGELICGQTNMSPSLVVLTLMIISTEISRMINW